MEVADRNVDMQVAPRPRKADVEESSLLVEALVAREGHVGGEVAVGGVDQVNDVPLESLSGVDRAQDEVVLVQSRRAGEVGARLRRVEGELGGEPLETGGLGRGVDQEREVVQAWLGVRISPADEGSERLLE
jgi:hypothetical protein